MKIQCIDSDIRKVLESGIYTIPRFQRPFSWDRENIDEFWNDTTSDVKKDYFIGSIVTYNMGSASYGLVDGQQRLTTITIALCAVRDKYLELGFSAPANGVHRLIETHDLNNQAQFVLKAETSYPFLQAKIQSFHKDHEDIELGEEERAIGIAYHAIASYIKDSTDKIVKADPEKSKPAIKKWLDKIRDTFLALKVIWITLETQDDAYLIFETLNTRGKDLTAADLVKNHVLRLLPNKGKALDRPKDYWLEMQSHLEGSPKPIQMKTFLHHYWLSKYPFTTEKQLFKSIRNEVKAGNVKEVMDELRSDCILYRGISEPDGLTLWTKTTKDIQDSLFCISDILNIQIANPLLLTVLRLYKDKKLKDGQVREVFSLIEKYHFMYTSISALPSSGGVTQMYAVHARELANAQDTNSRGICIQDFKKKIKSKIPLRDVFVSKFKLLSYANTRQRDIIRYALWKLNNARNPALGIDRSSASIEHLLPQSANNPAMHSLGNLILVPVKYNGEVLGNKTFDEKRKLLTTGGYPLEQEIQSATMWSQSEIEKRLSALADYAYDTVWAIK
ncbi:DUF262 domain-containing protein [Pseudomonas fluorescens]|uniref:DUF262 domain-containing protein n=1 Tax=Pseudomonas fluorescens TaxID=294 RepID=UPI003D22C227